MFVLKLSSIQITVVFQKALIQNFIFSAFYFKISFVYSQHKNSYSKGDFVLKTSFKCLY